jgi:cysteine desulfuration protein SufE
MSWPTALQEMIDDFIEIDDQFEKLEVVMDFSDEVVELPFEEWNETNKIHGCQSEAHVDVSIIDGIVKMRAGADAQIVQGLMGILTIAVNGTSCEDVMNLSPDFAEEMGILNSLTPSRSNGFRTMFDMIQNSVKEMM